MSIKIRALGALAGVFAFVALTGVAAAADRPYTQGSVVNVASIRTEPGMFNEYMKYLAGPYKQMMEEQKKAGIILSWNVYSTTPRGPDDPDIYLVTVYKDMAALDGLSEKTDPITDKIWGGMQQSNAAAIERSKMRSMVGSELMRELILK